jgi:hypothetical protein
MSAHSRRKGKVGEREVANAIRLTLGLDAHRGCQARAGTDTCDVEGVPGLWVESKRGKQPNVRAALRQATEDSDGRVPVAVIRDDGEDAFAVLSFDALLALMRVALRHASGAELVAAHNEVRASRLDREAAERASANERSRARRAQ